MTTASGPRELSRASVKDRLLHPGDLIDDRELKRADEDRFEHRRIAQQLVELAISIETPSNIALYGPWGSGKTGIANLMRIGLKAQPGVKFARFDAFKYAENPLRRKFVSAIASELGIKDPKYHGDLYSGRTRSDIRIPTANLWKVFGMFLGLIMVIAAVLASIIAVIAWAQSGGFKGNFKTLWGPTATAGLLPAALLAALVALVGKSLQVDRVLARPDSDEQFESLLADLVKDSKARRVVIFVDELDRCAAKDVVATLDAVRTFLGVDRCIFVVAADQHVLEQALSDGSEQATPTDSRNPYYSTGSAYLDKVFQYQLSLPDLLPPNITEFAVNLVKDRAEGLWSELPRRDFVISVLIPSHVTSPRRVKHLLNAFALTYRLAEDRHRSGALSTAPGEAAAALAKLACLRVEFPLFAQDLAVDDRLPELVLAIADDGLIADEISPEVEALAHKHATRAAQAALLLNNPAGQTGLDNDNEDDEGGATDLPARVDEVKSQHHRQFLNYLRRTATVPGLSRDLIYLKTEAAISGLPTSLAQELTTAAEDGDAATVARILTDTTQSSDSQAKALEYLVSRMNHTLGVEAENIATTLLLLAARNSDVDLGRFADDIVTAVGGMLSRDASLLNENNAPGAWRLALVASYDTTAFRRDLIDYVADNVNQSGLYLITAPAKAMVNRVGINRIITRTILSDDYNTVLDALDMLDPADRVMALDLCSDVPPAIKAALSGHDEAKKAAASAPSATLADPSATGGEGDDSGFDPEPILSDIARMAHRWAETDPASGYAALRFLLAIDHVDARNAAESVLGDFPTVSDPDTVTALLSAASRRTLTVWPAWLERIEPGPYPTIPPASWSSVARRLWAVVSGGKAVPMTTVVEATGLLATLTEPLATQPDLTALTVENISSPVEANDDAPARIALLHRVRVLTSHGFINDDALDAALVATLTQTVQATFAAGVVVEDLISYVREFAAPTLLRQLATHGFTPGCDALINAIGSEDNWIPEPACTEIFLEVLTATKTHRLLDDALVPSVEDITALVKEHKSEAADTLRLWLPLAEPTRPEAQPILDEAIALSIVDEQMAEAFAAVAASWPPLERLALLRHHIGKSSADTPAPNALHAAGLKRAPDDAVAELLIARFGSSSNNPARTAVLDLWLEAEITDAAARAKLFDKVATPMVSLRQPGGSKPNREAVKAVLTRIKRLGAPPRVSKKAFDRAIEVAIDGDDQLASTAAKALSTVGYSTKKSGLPFMRREVPDLDG